MSPRKGLALHGGRPVLDHGISGAEWGPSVQSLGGSGSRWGASRSRAWTKALRQVAAHVVLLGVEAGRPTSGSSALEELDGLARMALVPAHRGFTACGWGNRPRCCPTDGWVARLLYAHLRHGHSHAPGRSPRRREEAEGGDRGLPPTPQDAREVLLQSGEPLHPHRHGTLVPARGLLRVQAIRPQVP
jgi:hypothetical protein